MGGGGEGREAESEDGGDGGSSAAGALVCDRCGCSLPVRRAVVTAQAEVLCRACFDERATPAPPADGDGGAS